MKSWIISFAMSLAFLAIACGLFVLWVQRFPPIDNPELLVEQAGKMLAVRFENVEDSDIVEGALTSRASYVPREEWLSEINNLEPFFLYFDSPIWVGPPDRLVIVLTRRVYYKAYIVLLENSNIHGNVPENWRETNHPMIYKLGESVDH